MEVTKLFFVVIGVVVLQQSEAFKCYMCASTVTGCADPFTADDKLAMACVGNVTTCLKVGVKGTDSTVVSRRCNLPNTACTDPVKEDPTGTFTYCCTGSECNAAGQICASFLLVVSTLLASWM